MNTLLTSSSLISLFTLTVLEIVLGIDNIIFVSIVSNKLPRSKQSKARNVGLLLALGIRILLLFGLSWIIGLTAPWITVMGKSFTGKDIILLLGGFFLIGKSVSEIHGKLEGAEEKMTTKEANATNALGWTIAQIAVINLIFSFDSILTAIGLAKEVSIMILAVILSSIIMALFAKAVNDFINRHPTFKILALAFLIMIGFLLAMEAFGYHIDKGYVYFAMAFAVGIEVVNMQIRKRSRPVKLHNQEL